MIKAARLFFSLLLLVTCYLLHAPPASAQAPSYLSPNTNADVPQNLHTWTQTVMVEVLAAFSCQLTGVDPINPNQSCLGVDQKTGKIGFTKQPSLANGEPQIGGAIGVTAHIMTQLFQPPIRTSDYLAYLGGNFGIAKKAYAQGAGLEGLSPLTKLWETFRNVVYLGFVIVFVVIGLAIMLRLKIDPRTVMSIQNQIPKIIIGLILVTFSFAIAGFLIDLMYLSMYLIFNIIASADLSPNLASFNPALLQGKSVFDAVGGVAYGKDVLPDQGSEGINDLASRVADAAKGMMKSSLGITGSAQSKFPITIGEGIDAKNIPEFVIQILSGRFINIDIPAITNIFVRGRIIDGLIDALSIVWSVTTVPRIVSLLKDGGPLTGDILVAAKLILSGILYPAAYAQGQFFLREILPWLIFYIIIVVALLGALLRLAFELIKAYIYILLGVVLAPFWIVGGLFPNSPIGFGTWLRDIVANLSAFPVTLGMFLLGRVFIDVFNNAAKTDNLLFQPPLIGNPTGGDANIIGPLIGIGIILMTPSVVTMMKELLKSPQLKYTAAIGQAVGTGVAATNVPELGMKLGQMGYYRQYLRNVPLVGGFLGKFGGQEAPTTGAK